jgi:hypothetical protein
MYNRRRNDMGQAKDRGTKEQRIAQAKARVGVIVDHKGNPQGILASEEAMDRVGTGPVMLSMAPLGHTGFAVRTTIADIEQALVMAKTWPKDRLQGICRWMARHFMPAYECISKGQQYWDGAEWMDKEKFDSDMIWYAVYHQALNGTPFAISKI